MAIQPYPMMAVPEAVPKVWGGRGLVDLVKLSDAPDGPIGEIWSLSALEERSTRIANGQLAGLTVSEALSQIADCSVPSPFPVLVKVLEAKERLSVQVHPSDEIAQARGLASGKSEVFIVLRASPGAGVIHGFKQDVDLSALASELEHGDLDCDRYFRTIPVKEGDVVPIPPGTVHATVGELMWVVVQQSTDLAYRLYDWGRRDANRPLHVREALEAIRKTPPPQAPAIGLTLSVGPTTRRLLFACRQFIVEEINISGQFSAPTRGHRFEVLMGLRGKPNVECRGDRLPLLPGLSCLIPGPLPFELSARAAGRVLRVYQADLNSEIRPMLEAAGHPPEKVAQALWSE